MGWGRRAVALLALLVFLGLGAWPVTLMLLVYVIYSFRGPSMERVPAAQRYPLENPGRPMGRYFVGGSLLLLSLVAAGSGGTYSPVVFLAAGAVVILWPSIDRAVGFGTVVPVRDTTLLRSRYFPLSWHALAEVKLESQGQTRGIAAMSGRILLFGGRAPAVFQVVSVHALAYRQAEARVLKKLRRETRLLSQRGAHLLPADSAAAASRLSLELERLDVGTEDFRAVSSLPFDAAVFLVRDGRVISHRAFNILQPNGSAGIPTPDLKLDREPLFAEVVQEVGEKHGWPGPDEFSPFLAALDATRSEPIADRLRPKGEPDGGLAFETAGGAEVRLTRAQLRALARIYA